jgi:CheY-like chemotaxis protein
MVLLDMSLPDMSGLEVLRTLRASVHPQSPPVVMFSIDDDRSIRDKALQLGATDFASKGKPADLLRVVASYVRPSNPPQA